MTKPSFGLMGAAERLLKAVAAGAPESVELASALALAVLRQPLVTQAMALDELLRSQSPLALVRAVALAELTLLSASGLYEAQGGLAQRGGDPRRD